MAGPFTHWMVVETLLGDEAIPIDHLYFNYLRDNKPYVLLGAVGPDYPYLAPQASWDFSWADQMHREKTDGMIRLGLENLVKNKNYLPSKDDFNCALAWLFGYAAHVITDCVIHPVVNVIVGGKYSKQTKVEHRHCEMVQDVYVFKQIKDQELTEADYPNILKKCSISGTTMLNEAVKNFWIKIIEENYPQESGQYFVRPENWHEAYMMGIGVASEYITSRHSFLFFVGLDRLAYKISNQLKPEELNKFIIKISSPAADGSVIEFDQAFNNTTKTLKETWEKMMKDLDNLKINADYRVGDYLRNWNLDTGIPKGGKKITFWS